MTVLYCRKINISSGLIDKLGLSSISLLNGTNGSSEVLVDQIHSTQLRDPVTSLIYQIHYSNGIDRLEDCLLS